MARTENDYWNSVKSMAEEIVTEHGFDSQNWHDAIHESVDGSGWIIYYENNETVLNSTNNEPNNKEVSDMTNPDGSWKDFRQTAAYLAMTADVSQECYKFAEEHFACDCCGEVRNNEEAEDFDEENLCQDCADKRVDVMSHYQPEEN